MAVELYFIRHGHRADQEETYTGGPNPSLSEKGRRQAAYVGQASRFYEFDVLYTSTMHRALETAQPIYNALGIPFHAWPALGETALRTWATLKRLRKEGLTEAQIQARVMERGGYIPDSAPPDDALLAAYPGAQFGQPFEWSDAWGYQPLCLEGQQEAYARAERVIVSLKRIYKGQDIRIALVGHGNFGSIMMSLLLQCAPQERNLFSQANGAISRVDLCPDGSNVLRFLNEVSHLPHELRDSLRP